MIHAVQALFERGGHLRYGEGVTVMEHALQSAMAAKGAEAPASLIIAALLHDVGHLLHDLGEDAAERGDDTHHEATGARWLSQWFPKAVTEPVRLHVGAKRYLCAREPGYHEALSKASRLSLGLQGGPMTAAECAVFETEPHFDGALALRRWDDRAKVAGLPTPTISHYLSLAAWVAA